MKKCLYSLLALTLLVLATVTTPPWAHAAGSAGVTCPADTTYYVATTGNDANNGTAGSPFRTIAKALTKVAAGQTVCVRAGTYAERINLSKSGTAGHPITIVGESGATLDAGNRYPTGWVLATDVDPNTTTVWKKTLPYSPNNMTWNGKWTYPVTRAGQTQAFTWFKQGFTASNTYHGPTYTSFNGLESFFGVFGGVTYVRLPEGRSPATEDLAFAPGETIGYGFFIRGKAFITIRGFTIRNARPAVYVLGGSTNIILENNTFIGGHRTVMLSGGLGMTGIVIRHNEITLDYIHSMSAEDPLHWFIWSWGKATQASDPTGIALFSGGNTQVYGNHIYETWNGIGDYNESDLQTPGGIDVYNNRIESLADDGIEIGNGQVNGKWHDNIISNVNIGIRIGNPGLNYGPIHIYRNKIFSPDQTSTAEHLGIYWYKGNVPAAAYVYHNSISAAICMGFGTTDSVYGQPQSRVVDNAFSCARGLENNWGSKTPYTDYNWFGGTPNMSTGSWIGTHNVLSSGNRLWTRDIFPSSFTLPAGSSAIDAGVDVMAASTTLATPYQGLSSGYFNGRAPDIGATEYALDTIPPVLSAVAATPTSTSATVTWTTDETADSQVEYGLTVSYGSSSTLDSSLVSSHSVPLTGLSAGTLYHYRVKSRDAAGNLAVSSDATFTTAWATTSANLVGYWPFEDGWGTLATDASGNSNTGTLFNGLAWSNGKVGGAVSFDGVNDAIGVADSPSLDTLGAAFTVAAWVYSTEPDDGANDARTILGKGDVGWEVKNTFLLDLDNAKRLSLTINDGISSDRVSGARQLQLNTWYHVVGTFSGTQLAVYVNGVSDAAPRTKTISGSLVNSGVLIIGRQSAADCASPYNGCWKGLIDDVRVYNRALSATEVQALYNGTAP